MKYVVILGDGMADESVAEFGNQTPLEAAQTPVMDKLAQYGEVGLAYMVPAGMPPGSDTANLSVLGYDPRKYYTGRSPLEALSIGVELEAGDVSLRCNLVTLSEEEVSYEKRHMSDHSAGEISTEEAETLLAALKIELKREGYTFYRGVGYRHLLVCKQGEVKKLTPPHDILTKRIEAYLPEDSVLREMMERSYGILKDHPINVQRKQNGKAPANSIWFWGAGTRPVLDSFTEKTNKLGAMISATDLLKGIAVGSGMKNITVPGANGGLHTNYEGKAKAAAKALLENGFDFVYVHVEAPDEMGHQGNPAGKKLAIEYLDQRVIAPLKEALDLAEIPYRMLILPDHPTPVRLRTHTDDPVPYLLYDSTEKKQGKEAYHEGAARESGVVVERGYELIEKLFEK